MTSEATVHFNLSGILKAYRNRYDLTQQGLVDKMIGTFSEHFAEEVAPHLNQRAVSRWEQGGSVGTPEAREALAYFFGWSHSIAIRLCDGGAVPAEEAASENEDFLIRHPEHSVEHRALRDGSTTVTSVQPEGEFYDEDPRLQGRTDLPSTTVRFFKSGSGREMIVSLEHGQILADVSAAVGASGFRPKVLDRVSAQWDADVAAFDGDQLAGLIIVADAGDESWGLDQAIDHAERSAFRAQRQAPGVPVIVYMTGDLPDDLEPHVQLLTDTDVDVVVEPEQLTDIFEGAR